MQLDEAVTGYRMQWLQHTINEVAGVFWSTCTGYWELKGSKIISKQGER